MQFQIDEGELVVSAYQRGSDANLGNVHIYENNIDRTKLLLAGDENVRFELNT